MVGKSSGESGRAPGPYANRYARLIIRFRWSVVVFWSLLTLGALAFLPGLGSSHDAGLKGLIPRDTPAIENELRSLDLFPFPILARTALVQRNPDGLSVYAQARTVTNAAGVSTGEYDDVGPLLAALPITNAQGLFPGSAEEDTAALSFLFFDPSRSLSSQVRAARDYGRDHFTELDHVVGVTGSVPARAQQGRTIRDDLPVVELTTLGAIVLIVAVAFRSAVAPVITLVSTGVAFILILRTSAFMVKTFDIASPSEIEPVVAALLLGVMTDYVVFYLASLRHELQTGQSRDVAIFLAVAQFTPIVAVAGLAVAAGTAALVVARSAVFNAMGPGLALTVIIGLVVATTLVPALLAILGRLTFWPGDPSATATRIQRGFLVGSWSRLVTSMPRVNVTNRIADSRRTATWLVVACTVGLTIASLPLSQLRLSVSFVDSLAATTQVRQTAQAAQDGFADGILSPTVVIVEGNRDLVDQRTRLGLLGDALRAQENVAGVIGPGDLPPAIEREVMLSGDRRAARYLVVLGSEPLGARAITSVRDIESALPSLLADSGLAGSTAVLAGDSSTASFIVAQTEQDVFRIALAALLANLLMLLLFLRALVAAVYLLVASILSLTATLGITTLVFEQIAPGDGLVFYVPFTAAVLLLAFGSDYNIFGVGHVWDHARHLPLAEAIRVATPRTTRAIVVAGLALATSFGLLALVPLAPFRQLAFAMAVGIAIDVLIVRSLLMPALLRAVGPVSAWPSRGRFAHAPGGTSTTSMPRSSDRGAWPSSGKSGRTDQFDRLRWSVSFKSWSGWSSIIDLKLGRSRSVESHAVRRTPFAEGEKPR